MVIYAGLILPEMTMKNLVLVPLLFLTFSTFAADSSVLKEIMGESVYERSGIGDLNEEQIKVLEGWILNNAVEKRVVTKPKQKPKAKSKPQVQAEQAGAVSEVAEASAEPEKNDLPETQAEDHSPRYVRLAEPEASKETAEDEPVTQKYVLVDSLEERDRELVEPDLIRSRIDGPFKGWKNNKTRFRLENGEVWEQRQSSTYITNLDSPEVIIRKRRFGYTMEVPAVGRRVHVKRIR